MRGYFGDGEGLFAKLVPGVGEGRSVELLTRDAGERVVDVDVVLVVADEQHGVLVLGGVD